MIYITGDCHANFSKFSTDNFPEQKNITKDDFVIVCGDFGLWNDDKEEHWWFKWLSEKSFFDIHFPKMKKIKFREMILFILSN